MSVEVLRQDDLRFPRELFFLEKPPGLLYAQGDLSLLTQPRVSIIGSREGSAYGERVAYEAAHALAGAGVVIVSGMAMGLDARAHRGALDAGGGTIAILGTGIDIDYPRRNRMLLGEVRAKGLVLTEFEPGEPPLDWHFPKRNRIIAALGQCLLVVEGRVQGGTSNTAKWALGAGATIFGVPGRLGEEMSESPNLLIQTGGSIYLGPNDILQRMGLPLLSQERAEVRELRGHIDAARCARAELTDAEATLYDLIGPQPVHVDALATKSAINPGLLLAALSSLELQGLVTQLPGKHFALAS